MWEANVSVLKWHLHRICLVGMYFVSTKLIDKSENTVLTNWIAKLLVFEIYLVARDYFYKIFLISVSFGIPFCWNVKVMVIVLS